jgi:hypothetical protein
MEAGHIFKYNLIKNIHAHVRQPVTDELNKLSEEEDKQALQ